MLPSHVETTVLLGTVGNAHGRDFHICEDSGSKGEQQAQMKLGANVTARIELEKMFRYAVVVISAQIAYTVFGASINCDNTLTLPNN